MRGPPQCGDISPAATLVGVSISVPRPAMQAIRRYPLVVATLVVAAFAGLLMLTDARAAVPWIVSAYALVIAGHSFVGMVRDLLHGHAGVDVLAVLAITASVLVGEHWAALIIVLMITGGEALEDYAANRAKRELTALLDRSPQSAHRIHTAGQIEEIPIDEVRVGDELLVKASEVVPVDAVLLTSGVFDESGLTGESLPVEREPGSPVLSGIVNGSEAVRMRATAIASESQYASIIALVEEASASRSRVVRLADRFAVPFTLVALVIAGIAWWVSGDATRVAEVLVVATPCPLIIAAPVAYLGGMSRAARAGIIVKNAVTLEQLSAARTIAFDKTGTLTDGRPVLDRFEPQPGVDVERALQLAKSAEQYSTHVLAGAIAQSSQGALPLVPAERAEELETNGVRAVIEGQTVTVGKRAFIAGESHSPVAAAELHPGEQAAYVAVDGRFVGVLYLRDHVRSNAKFTVDRLRDMGLERLLILTGDAHATAEHVATELGISEFEAECLPADKVNTIHSIQETPVVMVGDGLNDAPVLAAADVGMAMGARGATAASESADAVLLVDDISRVASAVEIGRDTMRIALQSIGVGIALSIALMLVAAFGFLPAIIGAWLQEVIDLVVILAALRALKPRRRRREFALEQAPLAPSEHAS